MQRRHVILAMACAGAGLLTGCVASQPSRERVIRSYTEEVSSILIAADDTQIVFLGANYHYIFRASPALLALLRSPLRGSLVAEFYTFTVYEDQRVVGKVSVGLAADATPAQVAELGRYCERDNICQISHLFLSGVRYSANPETDAKLLPLQRSYRVNVNESSGDGYFHAPQDSPIKKLASGILLIGLIPLILVVGLALPCCGSGGH